MESKSLSVSNPDSDFDPKSSRLMRSIQSFQNLFLRAKLVPLFGSLSRFTGVRDMRPCRKSIILAQRRRGAEKTTTIIPLRGIKTQRALKWLFAR